MKVRYFYNQKKMMNLNEKDKNLVHKNKIKSYNYNYI